MILVTMDYNFSITRYTCIESSENEAIYFGIKGTFELGYILTLRDTNSL